MSEPPIISSSSSPQFLRQGSLFVTSPKQLTGPNSVDYNPAQTLDLSALRFRFSTTQQDVESPNTCSVRVYNLSDSTLKQIITTEYSRVVVQAGYGRYNTGVVFDGEIRQFKIGRENSLDSYLDILAADGDLAYNFAFCNGSIAANSSPQQRVDTIMAAMNDKGVTAGYQMDFTGGILPRGKVLFGMARAALRRETESQGATWNINNGQIDIVPLDGYRPGERVELTVETGLIGMPEQTEQGVQAVCLLNPRLSVGALFSINNASINRLLQANGSTLPAPPYNRYAGIQNLATVAADGIYRAVVVEHEGDTRGQQWYTRLIGLAVSPVTRKVESNG